MTVSAVMGNVWADKMPCFLHHKTAVCKNRPAAYSIAEEKKTHPTNQKNPKRTAEKKKTPGNEMERLTSLECFLLYSPQIHCLSVKREKETHQELDGRNEREKKNMEMKKNLEPTHNLTHIVHIYGLACANGWD